MNHLVRQGALAAEPVPASSTRQDTSAPAAFPTGAALTTPAPAESLTAREQAVFTLLRANPGRLYTRADILERVWGLEFSGDERVVDAYVNRIRRKLEGGDGTRIETVRGAGYRCVPPAGSERTAWPHRSQLPAEAMHLLELVSAYGAEASPAAILQVVLDNMGSVPGLDGAALLRLPTHGSPEVLASAGAPPAHWPGAPKDSPEVWIAAGGTPDLLTLRSPAGAPVPALLLPVAAAGAGLALAFTGQSGVEWDAGVQASLSSAARLIGGSLTRALDVQADRQAHQLLLEQVRVLEDRALKARQDSGALLTLTHLLEDARSVPDILNVSLPVLAELAGTDACAAWFPQASGPASAALHRTGLPVNTPADQDGGAGDQAESGVLTVEIGEQTLRLRPFGTRTPGSPDPAGPREASLLLPAAARCVALALTQATLLRALERSALTDEYTGLGNRQAFLADLHAEVAFAARHGARFGVTLVDLGNIRYLNATSGYAGGNDLISRLARTLRTVTRAEDRAYRLNGATFALLLRFPPPEPAGHAAQDQAVRGWQDRLGAALTHLKQGAPVPLDLQTSLVVCPEDAASTSELLRLALDHLSPFQFSAALPEADGHPSPLPRTRPA